MTKKDEWVYIRIEEDWKKRLSHLFKTYPQKDETTEMAYNRKLLKEAITREEKRRARKRLHRKPKAK